MNDEAKKPEYATCDRIDCPEKPEWMPVLLLVPSRTYLGPAMRITIECRVCTKHRDPNPDIYITEELWLAILADFKKRPNLEPPKRKYVRVEYVAYDEGNPVSTQLKPDA